MIEAHAQVGDHYGGGKQAHIPIDVLDEMGVDVGDTLEFLAFRDRCIITTIRDDGGEQ